MSEAGKRDFSVDRMDDADDADDGIHLSALCRSIVSIIASPPEISSSKNNVLSMMRLLKFTPKIIAIDKNQVLSLFLS